MRFSVVGLVLLAACTVQTNDPLGTGSAGKVTWHGSQEAALAGYMDQALAISGQPGTYTDYLEYLSKNEYARLGISTDTNTRFVRCGGEQMYRGVTPEIRASLDGLAKGDPAYQGRYQQLRAAVDDTYPQERWIADIDRFCAKERAAFESEQGAPLKL